MGEEATDAGTEKETGERDEINQGEGTEGAAGRHVDKDVVSDVDGMIGLDGNFEDHITTYAGASSATLAGLGIGHGDVGYAIGEDHDGAFFAHS